MHWQILQLLVKVLCNMYVIFIVCNKIEAKIHSPMDRGSKRGHRGKWSHKEYNRGLESGFKEIGKHCRARFSNLGAQLSTSQFCKLCNLFMYTFVRSIIYFFFVRACVWFLSFILTNKLVHKGKFTSAVELHNLSTVL